MGCYDESRKVFRYWGVSRGSVDGVYRCHGFVVVLVKGLLAKRMGLQGEGS